MRINNIQTNYNTPKQNFKALRIVHNKSNYLSTLPEKIINRLDDIGKYLADTKYYNLDISKNEFYISHVSGERLYQPYTLQNAGNVLIIKSKQYSLPTMKTLTFKTTKEVEQICDRISSAPTQFERAAEILKCLDDYARNNHTLNENIVINPGDKREEKINKLTKKYGV